MAAILIITIACIILYRTGKASEMLEAFRIKPATAPATIQEAPQPKPEPEPQPKPEPVKLDTLDRIQAENKAIIILNNKGFKNSLVIVKMLTDADLLETIQGE